jgi:hypothetical protein
LKAFSHGLDPIVDLGQRKFDRQFPKPIRHTIGIAKDNFDIAAIDESGCASASFND